MNPIMDAAFCVNGGGIAGFSAALCAARHGVKTVLVSNGFSFDSHTAGGGIAGEIALIARRSAASPSEVMAAIAAREENLTVYPAGTAVCASLYGDGGTAPDEIPHAYRIYEKDDPKKAAAFGGEEADGTVFAVSARYLLSDKENLLRTGGTAALGQAAGTAAAIAVKYGITPGEVLDRHMAELQETLQYDGCFLPYCRREVSEAALSAFLECDDAVSGDILNLRTGIDWSHPIFGDGDQGFTMGVGASVEYHMDAPVEVSRTRIVFDADSAEALAKVYALEIETERGWEGILFENENTRRVITAAVCRPLTGIRLTVMETWGAGGVHLLAFDFE